MLIIGARDAAIRQIAVRVRAVKGEGVPFVNSVLSESQPRR
jgi:hypothetical protein